MRPWLALKQAGLAFRVHDVGLKTAPDWKDRILAFSGAGKVPVLVDGSLSVHESLAICEYVAELAPQAQLWPEDAKLRVLLNSPDEAPAADVLSHLSADTLLLQAQRLADWVIVDSPPLNHVAETLALAQAVDDLLIVVRIGKTNVRELGELAEMLAQQDIAPVGFVVMGGHARTGYY